MINISKIKELRKNIDLKKLIAILENREKSYVDASYDYEGVSSNLLKQYDYISFPNKEDIRLVKTGNSTYFINLNNNWELKIDGFDFKDNFDDSGFAIGMGKKNWYEAEHLIVIDRQGNELIVNPVNTIDFQSKWEELMKDVCQEEFLIKFFTIASFQVEKDGLLSLQNFLCKLKETRLYKPLEMATDGVDTKYIKKFISESIERELKEINLRKKIIQESIELIADGLNPNIFLDMLEAILGERILISHKIEDFKSKEKLSIINLAEFFYLLNDYTRKMGVFAAEEVVKELKDKEIYKLYKKLVIEGKRLGIYFYENDKDKEILIDWKTIEFGITSLINKKNPYDIVHEFYIDNEISRLLLSKEFQEEYDLYKLLQNHYSTYSELLRKWEIESLLTSNLE